MMSIWICLILAVMCLDSILSQSDSNLDDDLLWYKVASRYKELSQNDYYYFSNEKLTWFDAVHYCAAEGSHLAILNSPEEAAAVRTFLPFQSSLYTYYWLGYHDMFIEGKFITINCETLERAGFAGWDNKQPTGYSVDGTNREDCGSFDISGKLNDLACSFETYFICEHILKNYTYKSA